jgi:hypothetical protein
METKTFTIAKSRLQGLTDKIKKLNRKCLKIGVPEITLKIVKDTVLTRTVNAALNETVSVPAVAIEVCGESPIIAGWLFIAAITTSEAGNVFRTLNTTYPIPERFRTCDSTTCDHCHTIRYRKDTYIVFNPELNKFKQVGRQCLQDFTGHKSPEAYAQVAENWGALVADLSDEEGSYGFGGSYRDNSVGVSTLLYAAVRFINAFGYVSFKKAEEMAVKSTKSDVLNYLQNTDARKYLEEKLPAFTDELKAEADSAILWASELETDTTDDYLWNIHAIANSATIDYKLAGIAISIIPAYRRAMEKKQETKLMWKDEFYPAQEKAKIEVSGVFFKEIIFESAYGPCHLYFFNVEGYILVWKTGTSQCDLNRMETYKIKATVKKHSDYKGHKQTSITRAKITK